MAVPLIPVDATNQAKHFVFGHGVRQTRNSQTLRFDHHDPSNHDEPTDQAREAGPKDSGLYCSPTEERLRQLECLYQLSELVSHHDGTLLELLQEIVDMLPRNWPHPGACHVRLIVNDQSFVSPGFRPSLLHQSSSIALRGRSVGRAEIYYCEKSGYSVGQTNWDGASRLINTVAERVGKIIERYQLREELEESSQSLMEANTGLRAVISQFEVERAEIRDSIRLNIENTVLPLIHSLASWASPDQLPQLELLEKNLTQLTGSFAGRLAKICEKLAPAEIEVCNMIRNGLSTKEIAALRHVSPATVFKQRETIRRKLSLDGTNTNLTTYLMKVSDSM